MRDFFKGWRRKTGVMTLAMTCLFAAGWVRSLDGGTDGMKLLLLNRMHFLASLNSYILWCGCDVYGDKTESFWIRFEVEGVDFQLARKTTGFRLWEIPYWSIVLPLILTSAFLLLVKPRPKKPPNQPDDQKSAENTPKRF